MINKLYNSHSFLFPILRYSSGTIYPQYQVSFSFWGNNPNIPDNYEVGKWILAPLWCPKTILPHPSVEHEKLITMKCNRSLYQEYPYYKCHSGDIDWDADEETIRKQIEAEFISGNVTWTYPIDFYEAHITDVHVEDFIAGELFGIPYRQYKFTVDGYAQWKPCDLAKEEIKLAGPEAPTQIIEYSVDASTLDNGDILFSASIHTINPDESQLHVIEEPLYQKGEPITDFSFDTTFTIPGVPIPLTCTSYKLWKEDSQFKKPMWNIIYQCSGIFPASWSDTLPPEVVSELSYGLNGSTIRSVSGNITSIKRANFYTARKKITAYSMTQEPVYSLGSPCSGGVAVSDIPFKETKMFWKSTQRWDSDSGKEIFEPTELSYYRHEIEVIS